MAENKKSLTLTKTKVAEVEGEHRITFVASSTNYDRDGEVVNVGTFYLPVKGGGHKLVSDLGTAGADNVDVPLILDHDLGSVEKVIGSVRKAYFVNNELVFEAGISQRPIAQEMYQLLKEGHLDNAFSIQFSYGIDDYDTTTKTISNAEIIEVSLVTRGANFDARVLDVKSLEDKGETVEQPQEETPIVEEINETPVVEEQVENATEVKEEAKAEEEVKAEEEAEVEETEAEEEVETEPEVEEKSETEVEENNTNEEKEKPEMEEIAKSLVKEATQKSVATDSNYLASKSAMVDFARIIKENGRNAEKAWANHLSAKGITGDAILPSAIENIFFKAWEDNPTVLATFGKVGAPAGAVNAFTTESRALGHKKGEAKSDQVIENIRRDIKVKIIYKKLPIDLQDLIDDQTGELLRFRVQELADRVANEIVVSAILGDGRSEGTPDNRTFDGTRGLFSMKADIAGSTESGSFASCVATSIANVETDTIYDKMIKTIAKVKGDGRKIAVVPEGTLANLMLTKNEQGQYIFPAGFNFEQALGARIIELPEMEGAGYDVIAYKEGAYVLFGGENMVRTDFDLTYNQDVMLVERAVAGSLQGNKVCAGYVSANASA